MGYNLAELEKNLKASPAVVVAVNLLGLGDQYSLLSDIADRHNCPVVQDSAQCIAQNEGGAYQSPYIIWSFARGKPINFLGGGALLSRQGTELDLEHLSVIKGDPWRTWLGRRKAFLFNRIAKSPLYGLLSSIPGTGVGETIYSVCNEIIQLPSTSLSLLAPALSRKLSQPADVAARILRLVESLPNSDQYELLLKKDRPRNCQPVAVSTFGEKYGSARLTFLALGERGLGASKMYGVKLPSIAGIPDVVRKQQGFSGADTFAGRLLTLPIHNLVTDSNLEVLREILERPAR